MTICTTLCTDENWLANPVCGVFEFRFLEHIIHSPFFYSHLGGCTFAVTSYVIGVKSRCDSHHQSAPRGCEESS